MEVWDCCALGAINILLNWSRRARELHVLHSTFFCLLSSFQGNARAATQYKNLCTLVPYGVVLQLPLPLVDLCVEHFASI